MNVTWVLGLPTSQEKGAFLTLDLGGTNLRVCWIILSGQRGDSEITQSRYKLPPELKTGNAEELWDFVTDSLQRFTQERHLGGDDNNPLPLGFTFSYPATQDYIDHGVLQTWTKGFDIKGVEGCDVASQLRDALTKRVRRESPTKARKSC
jgi:hexokinase